MKQIGFVLSHKQFTGFSLKNSGFSRLCHKAIERLSDDITLFIIRCEPRFMSHCRKVDSNSLLSTIRGIFRALVFQHMV